MPAGVSPSRSRLLLASAGALAMSEAATAHAGGHDSDHAATAGSAKQATLHDGMRKLWEQHVAWTRLTIVSFAANTPELPATAGAAAAQPDRHRQRDQAVLRGCRRQPADHAAPRAHHGRRCRAAGGEGRRHCRARGREGRVVRERTGDRRLPQRREPPNWPRATLRSMMRTHLDQTIQEAVAQLTGDYAASVRTYDEIEDHILTMADALSSGIVSRSSRAASAEVEAPPRRAAGTSTNGRGGFRTCEPLACEVRLGRCGLSRRVAVSGAASRIAMFSRVYARPRRRGPAVCCFHERVQQEPHRRRQNSSSSPRSTRSRASAMRVSPGRPRSFASLRKAAVESSSAQAKLCRSRGVPFPIAATTASKPSSRCVVEIVSRSKSTSFQVTWTSASLAPSLDVATGKVNASLSYRKLGCARGMSSSGRWRMCRGFPLPAAEGPT